jgi:hypothetical protein
LPDIKHSSGDAFSGQEIRDFAVHQSWVSAWCWVLDDAATEFAEGGIRRPEGAENGRGCGVCALGEELVGNFVDESMKLSGTTQSAPAGNSYDSRPSTSEIR